LKVICESAVHPGILCCDGNLCNWNITPPFPTELPSKLYSYCTAEAGFTCSWTGDEKSRNLKFAFQAWKIHGNKKNLGINNNNNNNNNNKFHYLFLCVRLL